MKTLNLTATVLLLVMLVAYSCSDNSYQPAEKKNQSELMKKGKDLAFAHNACLAKIFNDLSHVKTRSVLENKADLYNRIVESANDYITLNDEIASRIEKSDFRISIDEIKAQVSKEELFYIEEAISMNLNSSIDDLIRDVEADSELNEDRKLAVICFITTYNCNMGLY